MRVLKTIPYVAIFAAICAPISATAKDWSTRLGFGGHVGTSPYVGIEPSRLISPIATLHWRGFTVGTTGMSYSKGGLELTFTSATFDYSFDQNTTLRLGVVTRGSPFDSSAHPQLAGLVRNGWQEAILGVSYQISDATELSADVGRDISGTVTGGEITIASETRTHLGPLPIEAKIGMNWKSAEMAMYHYGVAASEVTGTRPAYTPGASFSPFISLKAVVPLSENAVAFTSLQLDALPSNVTSSPIIARSLVGSLSLGIGFEF